MFLVLEVGGQLPGFFAYRRIQSPHRVASPQLSTAITHLRESLGEATYESLARKGETMTTAAMVTYTYDQIDQARAALSVVSK